MVLVFLAAALVLSARFSATITRPVQRLQAMMDEAARGIWTAPSPSPASTKSAA